MMRRDLGLVPGLTRRQLAAQLLLLSLSACADKGPKTTGLRFIVQADELINPNSRNEPSPVVLRIYELKSLNAFQQANFFELLDNDTTALGQDLVGKREIEIKPGERQAFERATPSDTKYVGVIAGFRSMDTATWRASVEIEQDRSSAVVVKVTAQTASISLSKDKTFGFF
jgi:type VI secretion system protein VasD